METKNSEDIVAQCEASRAQVNHQNNVRHFNQYGVDLDPTRALRAVEPIRQIGGLDNTPLVAGQTDRVAPSHQTGGTSPNLGAPPSHQTDRVAPSHRTDRVAPAHQTLDHNRALVGSGHQPGGVVVHQTGGEASGSYEYHSGIDLEPSQAIVAASHQPRGVADGASSRGTYGVAVGHQTGGFQAGGQQETSNQGGQRRLIMPKVPTYIRQKYNSEDYDPLVASFGPYNEALHAAPDQRLALVEDFKEIALAWFITGTGEDANFWFSRVWSVVPNLRRCYTRESTEKYSFADFTRLLLRDASLAILVKGVANQEPKDIELLYNHLGAATVVTIIRDSFLLENQLPFVFIRDLLHAKFGFSKGEARWRKHFIISCHGRKARKDATIYWDDEASDPENFVEALKIAHLSGWKRENIDTRNNGDEKKEEERIVLLKDYYAVHSVTELKAKGITVQPNSTNSFKNITFQSGYLSGTLHFPVDFVNYGTKAAYSNIVAYEMTQANQSQDYTMTAYVHLMKSLLQSPKDVEELQANGIIVNMLGSNEQVMNLYRDIYTFGTNCSSKYGEICQKMEEHYNNRTKTWLAEFLYTYFRSPWTIIALFGSIFVVALTFIQTYYAVNQ